MMAVTPVSLENLDPTLTLLFVMSFGFGVSVGWIIRGRVHVRVHRLPTGGPAARPPSGGMSWLSDDAGRDVGPDTADGVPRPRGWFHRLTVALDRPAVYLGGLVLSVALGVTANAFSYHASERTGDLVACTAQYNVDAGAARDERADVTVGDRKSERALWVTFKRQIKATPGTVTQRDVLKTINDRIDAIDAVDSTTLEHPYPDPERCR
jgi:hypothetical protein